MTNEPGYLAPVTDPAGAVADALEVQPSYHLAAGSPCIDRGVTGDVPDRDIDGDPRPIGPAPDAGADEVVGDAPQEAP